MITAQLATIPGREESVRKTIESLLPQVDEIELNCNMFNDTPDYHWLNYYDKEFMSKCHRVTFNQRNNELYGDAAKFYELNRVKGYIFTCDDDLIYPPDYVQRTIEKIEQYGRKAVITYHGRTFPPRKIHSYYRDKLEGFRCLGTVEKNVQVHSGGTGVMAWHSDLWQPSMDWFKAANMADVFIGREAHRRGIPIICAAHAEGWITYIDQPAGTTIWEQHINDDKQQTDYWNEYWY